MSTQNLVRLDEVRAALERRRRNLLSTSSTAFYSEVFEHSPVSVWIEDWSKIRSMIDGLMRRGVKDWRRYFDRRPEQITRAVNMIHVVHVSAATLKFYGAESKEDAIAMTWTESMGAAEIEAFREQLIAFAEGASRFDFELGEFTGDGKTIVTRILVVIPPEQRDCWSRVIYSIDDVTERWHAEQALRESERRFAAAQRIAKLGHWLWDEVEKTITTFSDELPRLFGVEPEDFPRTSEDWCAFIHPDDRAWAVAEIERTIANQSGFDLEYRIVRTDGEVRYVHDLSEPIFDKTGRFVRTLGTLLDTTDLRQTERALRESEHLLAEAQRIAKLGHWVWDEVEDRQIYASEFFYQIWGTPCGTLFAGPNEFFATIHPDDVERVRAAIVLTKAKRKSLEIEYRIVRSDGETRFVLERSDIELDDRNNPVRTVGTVRDITERKHAEDALQEAHDKLEARVEARTATLRETNEALGKEVTERKKIELALRDHQERLQRLIESTSVIPWEADAKTWRFTYVGPQAETLFGYPREQWFEPNFWGDHMHPEDRVWALDFCLESSNQSENYEFEYRMIAADGRSVWLHDIVNVVSQNGEPVTLQGFMIDITSRKRAEDALQDLSARLITAQEEERSRIALELHDDFNQRLALLALGIEQIHDGLPESQEQLADGLETLLRHTKELSSDVHRLSHRLHPSVLQHLGLVPAARSLCKELSDRHAIHIKLVHHRVPNSIPVDVALCFYRIVQEALRNVIKHSGAESARVELNGTAEELNLRISDDGTGFDPESDQTRQGLGLLSMRERLRSVNGTISFERVEPTGTRIDVRVPLPAHCAAPRT